MPGRRVLETAPNTWMQSSPAFLTGCELGEAGLVRAQAPRTQALDPTGLGSDPDSVPDGLHELGPVTETPQASGPLCDRDDVNNLSLNQ